MKNKDVNYYIEMNKHADMYHRWREVSNAKVQLDLDSIYSWCKEDKELDDLRLEAMRAMDKYADALYERHDDVRDDICHELHGLKKPSFWERFFKKIGL